MEDNNKEMNGLDFNLEDIISQVDKTKKEAAEALEKIHLPIEELEMKPEEPKPEPAPAEPNFVLQPEEIKVAPSPAEPKFVLQPDPAPDKPIAPEFDMKPAEPIQKNEPAPDFVMTPNEKKEAAETLEKEFKGIDSSQMEKASDAYDKAHDEAAGMKVEAAENAIPSLSAAAPKPTPGSAESRPSGTTYSGGAHYAKKPSQVIKAEQPKKEKKYVTVGTLIGCMLLTLLLSTLLGSVLGGGVNKLINNGSEDEVNRFEEERVERNDKDLSQLNLSDATGSELTVAQIVDKNEDVVVEIIVSGTTQGMWGQMQLVEGAGSGVIVRDDGYIATNYHVIQGANKVEVTLRNGQVYPARIIGSDPSNDVAVIKIEETGLKTAEIGDSSTVDVGDLAVAIGNPLGQLGGSVTTGIISALDRTLSVEGTTLTLLQTDAAINGGNSGGGLFNSRGELIGIVESKASAVGVEGLGFALPINTVAGIINDIIEGGGSPSGQPVVGVTITEVSEDQSQYYGMDEPGVYIVQVTGTNAMRAGFQEGDRIISFNGSKINTVDEFSSLVGECKVGDTVKIVVSRHGQDIEIRTVLEERQLNQ